MQKTMSITSMNREKTIQSSTYLYCSSKHGIKSSSGCSSWKALAQEVEEITHQYNDYDWNYSLWNHVRHRRLHDVTASLKSSMTGA